MVYPNPFKSTFITVVDKPGDLKLITIFDITGRQVKTIQGSPIFNQASMGASLKTVTYVAQIDAVNVSKSFKIVKLN